MKGELGILIYIIIAIVTFLIGFLSVIIADKRGKRIDSPVSTDSLIVQCILISACWPLTIIVMPFIVIEDYRNRKPHCCIMGEGRTRYIYEKDTKDIRTLQKAKWGTTHEKSKIPFRVDEQDLEEYRKYFRDLRIKKEFNDL